MQACVPGWIIMHTRFEMVPSFSRKPLVFPTLRSRAILIQKLPELVCRHSFQLFWVFILINVLHCIDPYQFYPVSLRQPLHLWSIIRCLATVLRKAILPSPFFVFVLSLIPHKSVDMALTLGGLHKYLLTTTDRKWRCHMRHLCVDWDNIKMYLC